mmetsp:Transcript_10537/g.31729  ORF Transcript_10537/g.31729 Transcript_10537/m.31729 type:complete len:208 (-) Transcript_10537:2796-3419(-)
MLAASVEALRRHASRGELEIQERELKWLCDRLTVMAGIDAIIATFCMDAAVDVHPPASAHALLFNVGWAITICSASLVTVVGTFLVISAKGFPLRGGKLAVREAVLQLRRDFWWPLGVAFQASILGFQAVGIGIAWVRMSEDEASVATVVVIGFMLMSTLTIDRINKRFRADQPGIDADVPAPRISWEHRREEPATGPRRGRGISRP